MYEWFLYGGVAIAFSFLWRYIVTVWAYRERFLYRGQMAAVLPNGDVPYGDPSFWDNARYGSACAVEFLEPGLNVITRPINWTAGICAALAAILAIQAILAALVITDSIFRTRLSRSFAYWVNTRLLKYDRLTALQI